MTDDFEVAMANLMTENGIQLGLVDLAITRAPTRERPPSNVVLNELKLLHAQDKVRGTTR